MTNDLTRRDFLRTAAVAAGGVAAVGVGARRLLAARPRDNASTRPATQPTALPHRVLGKTGAKVSILGLGGAGLLAQSEDGEAAEKLVLEAMDSGITYFDTAHNYGKNGRSEKNLGRVMSTPRRRGVFLATKTVDRTYDGAMRQVETSLKRLGTDHVDLIQVHHACPRDTVGDFGKPTGVLPALRKLRDQKVVRFIGLTGHPNYPQVQEALEMYEWDAFMCFVNPAEFNAPVVKKQMPYARKHEMGIIAMKALGGSPGMLIGEGPGKASAPELLRYALSQPVTLTIPAVGSVEELRQNVAAVRDFKPMTEAERDALRRRINAPEKGWRETHDDTRAWMGATYA